MWTDNLAKSLIKKVTVTVNGSVTQHLDSNSNMIIKHENIKKEDCLICNSNNNELFGVIHKYDLDKKKYFYYLNDQFYPYIQKKTNNKNSMNIDEKDIQLVMDQTNLNREESIKELGKNDVITVIMNNSLFK
jgi:NACalpha-BTF3-like transcription factor